MWPSWVFGPGFLTPPAQLLARCPIRAQKGPIRAQKGPIFANLMFWKPKQLSIFGKSGAEEWWILLERNLENHGHEINILSLIHI